MWVKVSEGAAQRITITDLRLAEPDWSFAEAPSAESLAEFDIYPLAAVEPPEAGFGQCIEEGAPELVDGEWRQTWNVTDIPAEEIRAAIRPVTMRQARLALLAAGVLGDVAPALAALPSPHRDAAEIEWEYASEVRRDAPLIAAIGSALGLTEDQIDDLFEAAAVL